MCETGIPATPVFNEFMHCTLCILAMVEHLRINYFVCSNLKFEKEWEKIIAGTILLTKLTIQYHFNTSNIRLATYTLPVHLFIGRSLPPVSLIDFNQVNALFNQI